MSRTGMVRSGTAGAAGTTRIGGQRLGMDGHGRRGVARTGETGKAWKARQPRLAVARRGKDGHGLTGAGMTVNRGGLSNVGRSKQ